MKRIFRDYLFLALMAGIVVFLDQWSKAYVRNNLALGAAWAPWPWILPYARIVHWYNTGVAFGLFQGKSQLFAVLAVLVAVAIIYYFPRVPSTDWTLRIAMGLQLGGALGNLVDRIFNVGQVTDFISVGNFPVFNLADASISVGVLVLLLGIWLQDHKKPVQGAENLPPANDTIHSDINVKEDQQ
ncbi:MAG: signal peptidase II [Anaerolineaceae bacterium]|nr:signal peptidase II [Anaerolineaceae bacterium]